MSSGSNLYRIFILGAGFSRPAGLPLAAELWEEVRHRAGRLSGRAAQFRGDLDTYIEFRRDCDGITLTPEEVDFEDFLGFLDIEHHLGLRGSDTWSRDGNEAQVVVKTLIGQVLAEATPAPDRIPDLYIRFAEGLQPNDYVLTFNYDVLLERALEAIQKPFRLFPQRLQNVRPTGAEVDTSREEVILLKLHGSMDWFDRAQYGELEAQWREQGLDSGPPHPVFRNTTELQVLPLLEGPRFPNDPLREMHRVRRIEALYRRPILFHCTPWLLNPSSAKMLYSGALRDFWYGMGDAGALNFGLAIIGFSLPPQDDYARQVLYRIVKNYQESYWDEEVFDRKKSPLVLVDARKSKEQKDELEKRYAFVDWTKASVYMNGFDDDAIDLLFGGSFGARSLTRRSKRRPRAGRA